jgi:hypothetical protein
MATVAIDGVWKTERPKRGIRLFELQSGDLVKVGKQKFKVFRVLKSGKFLVRNVADTRGADALP